MKNVFSIRVLTIEIIERILVGVWVYYKISYDLGKYLLCKGKCHKNNLQELR